MILTIKGADFSGSGLGTNTSVSITLTKGNGVSGSKVSSLTLEKNQVVSTATVIATGLSLQTGYENLVVTVTMNGSTVSGWFSNGTVTIPANTTITGNIKITASATATSGGEVVEPEEPGTGGDNGEPVVLASSEQYSIDGFIRPAGTIGTASPYKRTDYIDITKYGFSHIEANCRCAALSVSPIAFFDENKEFISAVTATEETKDTAYLYSMDVPSNAAYVMSSTITGDQYGFTPYLHGYK